MKRQKRAIHMAYSCRFSLNLVAEAEQDRFARHELLDGNSEPKEKK